MEAASHQAARRTATASLLVAGCVSVSLAAALLAKGDAWVAFYTANGRVYAVATRALPQVALC